METVPLVAALRNRREFAPESRAGNEGDEQIAEAGLAAAALFNQAVRRLFFAGGQAASEGISHEAFRGMGHDAAALFPDQPVAEIRRLVQDGAGKSGGRLVFDRGPGGAADGVEGFEGEPEGINGPVAGGTGGVGAVPFSMRPPRRSGPKPAAP